MEDSFIKSQLVKFNVVDSEIAQLSVKFGNLTIKGIDDKEGYRLVRTARLEMKNYRVNIDKKRKELNEDALKWQRSINAEAKRLTDMLVPTEKYLETLEKDYLNEIEAIKRAEFEKAEADRKEKLRIEEEARKAEQARLDAIRKEEQARLDAQRAEKAEIARQQEAKAVELKLLAQKIQDREAEEAQKLRQKNLDDHIEKIQEEIKKDIAEPSIPQTSDGTIWHILTFMNKDYLFAKDPHGEGILMIIDGIQVLLPHYLIKRILND